MDQLTDTFVTPTKKVCGEKHVGMFHVCQGHDVLRLGEKLKPWDTCKVHNILAVVWATI